MSLGERRKGRVSIYATLALMGSVVLFISSLFWLTTNGPWNNEVIFGDPEYITTSNPIANNETESQNEHQTDYNLTEAVADLEKAGCVFTVYNGDYTEASITRLEYNAFKEEAVKRKIVFLTNRKEGTTVLLVEKNGQIFEWSP